MNQAPSKLLREIRLLIIIFIVSLILSGVTAFPIESELTIAMQHLTIFPDNIQKWLSTVFYAIHNTNEQYPFISYGTDWLAFAHIVIAVAFIGPLIDPVKNIWVIQFGMIACIMVFPLALIAGAIRGIPFYWRVLDCSFGIIGCIPLFICFKKIKKLELLQIGLNALSPIKEEGSD